MAFEKYYIDTDEIMIGEEGYQKEEKKPNLHYDEDPAEKAETVPATFNGGEKQRLVSLIFKTPAVQGSVARPSQATRNKSYFQERERFSRKEKGLHVLADYFPLTVGRCEDTLQYDVGFKRVTDYHEAMMDLIEREHQEEEFEKARAKEEK